MPADRDLTERHHAYTQARRFERLVDKAARAYLTEVHAGADTPLAGTRAAAAARALMRAAELADAWAARAVLPGRASAARIPRTALAARIQEHPGLFDPRVRPFGVRQRRVGEVARSIEGLARAIGRHLAARAEALADVRSLRARLLRGDITAQAALAYLEAAGTSEAPQDDFLDNRMIGDPRGADTNLNLGASSPEASLSSAASQRDGRGSGDSVRAGQRETGHISRPGSAAGLERQDP